MCLNPKDCLAIRNERLSVGEDRRELEQKTYCPPYLAASGIVLSTVMRLSARFEKIFSLVSTYWGCCWHAPT